MSNRSKSKSSKVPKAVLKQLEHTDEITLKRKLASIVTACLLDPKTSKKVGHEIELINNGKPLASLIRVGNQYFTIKVQEHR